MIRSTATTCPTCSCPPASSSLWSSSTFSTGSNFFLHPFNLDVLILYQKTKLFIPNIRSINQPHPSLHRKPFLLQMFGSIANSLDISRNGWAFIITNICIITTMATMIIITIKPCSDHHNSNRPGSTPDPFRIQPFGLYQLLLRFEELSFEQYWMFCLGQYLNIWLKFWHLTNDQIFG